MSNLSDLLEFGEWAPDQPAVASFARTVRNALSNGRYYRPLPKLAPVGSALPSDPVGAGSFLLSDGTNVTVAGTGKKLYFYSDGTWDDKSRVSGGDYNANEESRWQFVNYGNRILGTQLLDDIQSFVTTVDTNFSQLSASAPRAKYITTLNNFVLVGNTGNANNEVAWSGLDAPTVWGTNLALQADSQIIENGQGEVRGIFGSQNYGAILQQKGITRIEYVGPPDIFRLTDIERSRGAATPYGQASLGNSLFYLEENGFYRFDGTNSINISENRVSKWFLDDYDDFYVNNVSCVIDPVNTVAVWGYADNNANDGQPNKIIVYDWVDNRWTYGELAHLLLFRALSAGYTLEGLDAISSNLDTLPYSLDSNVWKGGRTLLGAMGTDKKISFFTGLSSECEIETQEYQINPSGRSYVSGLYVQSDCPNYTATLSSRNLPSENTVATGSAAPSSITGECEFSVDNRYHRATITFAEDQDWQEAVGVKARYTPTGYA